MSKPIRRNSFIFYRSFYEAIKELNSEDQAAILIAICEYNLENKAPKFEGIKKAIWILIQPNLDANNQKYSNGKLGGRPRGNQKETKKKPKHNLDETETKANVDEDEDVDEDEEEYLSKFKKLVDYISKETNKKFYTKLEDKDLVELKEYKNFTRLLGKKYDGQDFTNVVNTALADEHHIKSGYKYITPEFITRPDKFEYFLSMSK